MRTSDSEEAKRRVLWATNRENEIQLESAKVAMKKISGIVTDIRAEHKDLQADHNELRTMHEILKTKYKSIKAYESKSDIR